MIKTVIIALSGALVVVASPAFADAARPAGETATTALTDTSKPVSRSAKASSKQRYCVSETITGSRLPVKSCLTRDQWLEQGFDPLAK